MTTTAQDTITLVKTLFDLTNNHLSDPAWLDKSLALFAEECEVVDVPSGMTSQGPDGYKQVILFFEEGFPDSGIEITNLFALEDQAVVEFIISRPESIKYMLQEHARNYNKDLITYQMFQPILGRRHSACLLSCMGD